MSSLFSQIFTRSPPNFLTPFKFTTYLGQGSFGVVVEAIDKSKTSSAVKFIFDTGATEQQQQLIQRECQLAKECDHENVVKIIKFAVEKFTTRDIKKIFETTTNDEMYNSKKDTYVAKANRNETVEVICIQMQLCGENLRQWLCSGLDVNDGLVQFRQVFILKNIIEGLKYIHDKKILHRDLKPENVMFSKSGYQVPVKIGDFGLCRRVHSEESQTSPLTSRTGTQDYMAPEVFTTSYSFQADLYSLGLIIWEVALLIPFKSRRSLFLKLVHDEDESVVVRSQPCIDGVREVIIGLTKRHKKDRTRSVDEVAKVAKRWKPTGKKFTAKNTGDLSLCLNYVPNGGTIQLIEFEYVGGFVLNQDNVKVCGVTGSVLKSGLRGDTACLTIQGNGCSIVNVCIEAGEGKEGLHLTGSENRISNVVFTGGETSLHVTGDKNSLSNICGTNIKYGISVHGSHNNISKVTMIKNSQSRKVCGIRLRGRGSQNRIQNLKCSGYEMHKKDWGLVIDSTNSSVENSECGPILVSGMSATLTNIKCGDLITVQNERVKLIKCCGKMLNALKRVTLINCSFDFDFSNLQFITLLELVHLLLLRELR